MFLLAGDWRGAVRQNRRSPHRLRVTAVIEAVALSVTVMMMTEGGGDSEAE
jgi:hypothetical protein